MVLLMIKNIILNATVLSAALALSILVKADSITFTFAQEVTPKMQLEEGIKALQAGDHPSALMHLSEADKGISDQSARMHLDEAIKALQAGDTQGALMHLGAADQALGGSEG